MEQIDDVIEQRSRLFLSGIILFGAFLRLYHVNFQSLWLDELYSIVPTDPQNTVQAIIEYSKGDQPPLFFIYIHFFFKLFGYDELAGRVACALIGIVGMPAIYFLVKECGGKRAGLFAAFLTAINYFHIYYSQELRFYSMAFFFAALSYLFYIRAFKTNKVADFVFYILTTICLLYTHNYGLLLFGSQAVTFVVLLFYKRDSKFVCLSLFSAVIISVSFLPWISVILSDFAVDLGWIKMPKPYFVAQYFYDYTGKDAVTACALIFFCFLFFKSLRGSDGSDKSIVIIIVMWIILSYMIPYIRSVAVSPMLSNRYTIVTLPGWMVLFALGWIKIKSFKWKYGLMTLLFSSALINIFFLKQYYTVVNKDQFREASEIVLSKNPSNIPVFSSLPWHFKFYFRNTDRQVENFSSLDFSKTSTFWLLQAHMSAEEMQAQIEGLSDQFQIVERFSYFGANAILFRQKK